MKKLLYICLLVSFALATEPITPIPTTVNVDKKKVLLGKELFFDPILSKDNTISCHDCHFLNQGGVDNLQFSFGVEGKIGEINAPTVFNSVFNFVQFWDGRAKNLQEQALGPITNPVEMDHSLNDLLDILKQTHYDTKFKAIYKDGLTIENLANAIAEYEKTLITPNSPFDLFLKGDYSAISKEAKEGYVLFKDQGCIACHHGVNVGGNLYAKFGAIYATNSNTKGRYEVTKDEMDEYFFKVPSLRNIELTAPYMHDGRIETLNEAVKFMAYYQLGKSLSEEDINKIVAFLKSLTGELLDYE